MLRSTPRVFTVLVVAGVMALSSCQVIDDLIGQDSPNGTTEPTTVETNGGEETPDANGEGVEEELGDVPTCDTLYSAGLVAAFVDQGREFVDMEPVGPYGFGTVNPGLVAIMKETRADLKVSCTWILPDTESGSTTTVVIVAGERVPEIEEILVEDAGAAQPLGQGVLWKLDQNSSNLSGDYEANEAHFLAPIPCPESLAEQECTLWIATTFAFGSSEALTRDVAGLLGKL